MHLLHHRICPGIPQTCAAIFPIVGKMRWYGGVWYSILFCSEYRTTYLILLWLQYTGEGTLPDVSNLRATD